MVGACRWHVAKFIQNQLEFGLIPFEDATNACHKVVVAVNSHHRRPGLISWKSQMWAAKWIRPIRRYVTVSQEAKLINSNIFNSW